MISLISSLRTELRSLAVLGGRYATGIVGGLLIPDTMFGENFGCDSSMVTCVIDGKVVDARTRLPYEGGMVSSGGGFDPDDPDNEPIGGTYVLRDQNGNIVRSGRTNNLARREAEHARDPALRDYRFQTMHRTNSYAEQRGLEHMLHTRYNPSLNKIGGIHLLNPNKSKYLQAAQRYLKNTGGSL